MPLGEAGVKDPTTWGYWPSQAGSLKKESFENMAVEKLQERFHTISLQ